MEKWLLLQRERIDHSVVSFVPSHWPTLEDAYVRASNATVGIETLLGLLAYRPLQQLSEHSVQVFAAVQVAGLGMRMVHAGNTGFDSDGWIAQWGPLLTLNYGHGLVAQASLMIDATGLPSGQRHSLRALVADTYRSFLGAEDIALEGALVEPDDFEAIITCGMGALAGLGIGTATILRLGATPQLQTSLEVGHRAGQALHRLQIRHLLVAGQMTDIAWRLALLHSLEYDHPNRETLLSIVAEPPENWDRAVIGLQFQEIDLPQHLLSSARSYILQATMLAAALPEHSELSKLLWALVGGETASV